MCLIADIVETDDETATGAIVAGIAPQFVSLLPAVAGGATIIQDHVDIALDLNTVRFWGAKRCKAVAYHAAHTLALAYPALAQGSRAAGAAGASGAAIQTLKAGDLSLTFATAAKTSKGSSGSESYGDTAFGRMYLQLARSCRKSPRLVL